MIEYKVSRGYNIPLLGEAKKELIEAPPTKAYSVHPSLFHYLKPKLKAKEGESVKIGSPLFIDKKRPKIVFASPAAGKITKIEYGPRRIIEAIRIEGDATDAVTHKKFSAEEISRTDRPSLIDHLCEGGLWPYIRQRPFDMVADPKDTPRAIFVNCMDTAPLAADPEFLLQNKLDAFAAGVRALEVLSGGDVFVVLDGNKKDSIFAKTSGAKVRQASFKGKHPAGLVSTHIEKLCPILNHEVVVWYLNAVDVARLGSFLLQGVYPTERIVAITGEGATQPTYYKTRLGAGVASIVGKNIAKGEQRWISGNVLSGITIAPDEALHLYHSQLTLIPEGREEHFIAWMLPGFNRPTWSRTYLSALLPGRKLHQTTNQNGEHRALVKTGDYRKVVALDILPEQLVKAVLSEDIELMEKLGILEVAPEDVALCSYICPSKVEFTEIVQSGLDLMKAELS